MRLLHGLLLLSAIGGLSAPATLAAQFPSSLESGTRVRLWLPEAHRQAEGPVRRQLLRGTITALSADTLELSIPGTVGSIAVPRASIRRLEVSRGSSRAASAVERAVGGAIGGAVARAFDLAKAESGHWHGRRYFMPLSHGRAYSEEEIWENFTSFIREVAPVAEEAGVKIGIHPDDPPGVDLAGVPRCIFGNFDGYRRALEIADSPNVGVCFCVGCWLEGGALMGNGPLESIRYFAGQGRLFKVHFRNVDAPLPHFVETFVDDGYMDMYKVMRALREVGFDGVAIADHIPAMAGGPRVGTAYTIGYMKALIKRAEDEVGPR